MFVSLQTLMAWLEMAVDPGKDFCQLAKEQAVRFQKLAKRCKRIPPMVEDEAQPYVAGPVRSFLF